MGEPEVQSLVALILGGCQVLVFFLATHAIPCLFASLVSPDVIDFDEDCHHNVPRDKREKDFVALAIVGFIIRSIDLSIN